MLMPVVPAAKMNMDFFHLVHATVIVVLAAVVVWWSRWKRRGVRVQQNIPPGSFGLPLLGESLQFIASYRSLQPDNFIKDRRLRYGRIFTTHLFGKPTIVSLDPEVNRLILNSDGRLFVPDYPKSLRELWGKWAILRLEGSVHKRIHGLIATALKSLDFKDHVTEHIEAYVRDAMSHWSHKKLVLVEEEAKKISFNVTAMTLLSLSPGATTDTLRVEFHKYIAGAVSFPINLPGTTFSRSLKARERMVNLIKRIVEERQQSCKSCTSNRHLDILEVLIQEKTAHGETFPLELITDNLVTFLFPSEDSIAMFITLAVKFITECPEALQKLREENFDLIERTKGVKLTWSHYLSELPFTYNVLSETLRMGNIVKGVIRRALVDVPIKDFVVPKGWSVFPFFRGVHLDGNLYSDAETFNPWRWQEKAAGVNYTPFGGGPRYCAGIDLARLAAVVFLHHLVTQFRWKAEKDSVTNFPFVKLAKKLPILVEDLDVRGKS